MAWVIDTTRLYVQEINDSGKEIIARLQPIASGTVNQTFGWESPIWKVSAVVVGYTDHDAIEEMYKTGNKYMFSGVGMDFGDFYVNSVSFKRRNIYCQTLRQDLSSTEPVYDLTLELYFDEE
jgi:hypothetical protein